MRHEKLTPRTSGQNGSKTNRKPHNFLLVLSIGILISLCHGGCGSGKTENRTGAAPPSPTPTPSLPTGLLTDMEPAGATPVSEIKSSAKEGDEVTLDVVIGGRENPIVSERAVMTVIDQSVFNRCVSDDDNCPTPWDYCCASAEQLRPHMATVTIVDDANQPLKIDLANHTSLIPLKSLIVRGTVGPRPTPETLVVNASSIFIRATN